MFKFLLRLYIVQKSNFLSPWFRGLHVYFIRLHILDESLRSLGKQSRFVHSSDEVHFLSTEPLGQVDEGWLEAVGSVSDSLVDGWIEVSSPEENVSWECWAEILTNHLLVHVSIAACRVCHFSTLFVKLIIIKIKFLFMNTIDDVGIMKRDQC